MSTAVQAAKASYTLSSAAGKASGYVNNLTQYANKEKAMELGRGAYVKGGEYASKGYQAAVTTRYQEHVRKITDKFQQEKSLSALKVEDIVGFFPHDIYEALMLAAGLSVSATLLSATASGLLMLASFLSAIIVMFTIFIGSTLGIMCAIMSVGLFFVTLLCSGAAFFCVSVFLGYLAITGMFKWLKDVFSGDDERSTRAIGKIPVVGTRLGGRPVAEGVVPEHKYSTNIVNSVEAKHAEYSNPNSYRDGSEDDGFRAAAVMLHDHEDTEKKHSIY